MYLRTIKVESKNVDDYPFNLPIFKKSLSIDVDSPITIFVGDNGIGKSTLLEGLAHSVGFNVLGGGKNHTYEGENKDNIEISKQLKLVWNFKTSKGFFLRSENFMNFSNYIDKSGLTPYYGGISFNDRSHGEGFLTLFTNNFNEGLFILDEPESALSPSKILTFMTIINDLIKTGKAQFIISTHSPILLTFPNAVIYELCTDGVKKTSYEQTEHYQITKNFLENPERYFKYMFEEK